jgi:hypothetical protein
VAVGERCAHDLGPQAPRPAEHEHLFCGDGVPQGRQREQEQKERESFHDMASMESLIL